jgi:hypothetical protein
MPFVHGRTTHFSYNAVNLSAFCDNVDFPQTVETAETTTFGDTSKDYIVGLRDSTISISGKWDGAAGAIDVTLAPDLGNATARAFAYGPAGNTAGNVRYTGSCFCTSYQITGAIGDVVTFSAEFQVTGTVTRDTF